MSRLGGPFSTSTNSVRGSQCRTQETSAQLRRAEPFAPPLHDMGRDPQGNEKSARTTGPRAMQRLWERWKRVARKVGDVQARVLLSLVYFIVLGPFALAVRWWSDPLAVKTGTPRGWRERNNSEAKPMERAIRQF